MVGWCVGDGASIKLGVDSIAGLKSYFLLFDDIRSYLYDCGIRNLSHSRNDGYQTMSSSYWLSAEDLEIEGVWKEEWTNYTRGIYHGGFRLNTLKERILWMHNKNDGEATS